MPLPLAGIAGFITTIITATDIYMWEGVLDVITHDENIFLFTVKGIAGLSSSPEFNSFMGNILSLTIIGLIIFLSFVYERRQKRLFERVLAQQYQSHKANSSIIKQRLRQGDPKGDFMFPYSGDYKLTPSKLVESMKKTDPNFKALVDAVIYDRWEKPSKNEHPPSSN